MKKIFLFIALFLGAEAITYAQSGLPVPKMYIKGVTHQGVVHLRWIPADVEIFQKGNQYGYMVTRQLFAVNGTPLSNEDRIASTTVFGPYTPLPETEWDVLAETNDVAGVAQAAIYAEAFQAGPMNGDEFYEAVNKGAQNENRYGFGLFAADQSFEIARYMGLGLLDSTAASVTDGEYTYQVVLMWPDSLTRPRGAGVVSVSQASASPAPAGLQVTTSAGMAMLTLPRGNLEQYYTSFNMERSDDGGATWVKRNEQPLLFLSNNASSEQMMFNDTIETPGVTYKYRIYGHSPFGFDGPVSNVVEGTGPIPKLGVAPDFTGVTEVNGSFDLSWDFPADKNGSIQKFQVMRSDNAEAGFVVLGEPGVTSRTFNDPSPSPLYNYYKVVAIDQGNSLNESTVKLGQLNDETPPAVPSGLEAEVSASGLVTLAWAKNLEADLKGYRVYFSNSPDGDFAQITHEVLKANTYTHQIELQVLSKKVYYKVLATDFRENDSEYSAAVFIDRPDVIPPAKPILTKVDPLPIGVKLEWVYSTSDDVVRHELQRKVKNATNWSVLHTYNTVNPLDISYIDSTNTGTSEYTYRMVAFDGGEHGAPSSAIDVKPSKTVVDTIANFKVVSAVDGTQKQAKLSWEYPGASPVYEFQVYRSPDGMQQHLYSTFKVNPEEVVIDPATQRAIFIYKDKEIKSGQEYNYKVLAKFHDGSSSPLSKNIQFQY